MRTKTDKLQIGIRIPRALDKLLENRAKKIGVSKPAVILGLIYDEFKNDLDDSAKTSRKEEDS